MPKTALRRALGKLSLERVGRRLVNLQETHRLTSQFIQAVAKHLGRPGVAVNNLGGIYHEYGIRKAIE